MKTPVVQRYGLRLGRDGTYEATLRGPNRSGFRAPATRIGPKLYVVTQAAKYLLRMVMQE